LRQVVPPLCGLLFHQILRLQVCSIHEDFFYDFQALVEGRVKEAAWIAYRESAKTSIAKMGLAWIIARKQVID